MTYFCINLVHVISCTYGINLNTGKVIRNALWRSIYTITGQIFVCKVIPRDILPSLAIRDCNVSCKGSVTNTKNFSPSMYIMSLYIHWLLTLSHNLSLTHSLCTICWVSFPLTYSAGGPYIWNAHTMSTLVMFGTCCKLPSSSSLTASSIDGYAHVRTKS